MDKVGRYLFIAIWCISIAVNSGDKSLQCKDHDGKAVDWYVLYKLPRNKHNPDKPMQEGTKYLYITSKTVHADWKAADEGIDSKNSIPGRTLAPLYDGKQASKALWILYSDQQPAGRIMPRWGHTKGVLMTDAEKGFWLIHSVPKYPPDPSNNTRYTYPLSGKVHGQSFLCISFKSNQMEDIGQQLIYNQIIAYAYNKPQNAATPFRNLVIALNKKKIKGNQQYQKSNLTSMDGVQFVSFAKTEQWDKELYSTLVAPELQCDLYAQTWRAKLPAHSNCNGRKVLDVLSVKFDWSDLLYNSTKDHSKWAIATDNTNGMNWVCIGDINRQESQRRRGGGTVCVNSAPLWTRYRSLVSDYQGCPRP